MCFLWLSVHLQHAKNNSANMYEVGGLRFKIYSTDAEFIGLLNVIPRFYIMSSKHLYCSWKTENAKSVYLFPNQVSLLLFHVLYWWLCILLFGRRVRNFYKWPMMSWSGRRCSGFTRHCLRPFPFHLYKEILWNHMFFPFCQNELIIFLFAQVNNFSCS